MKRVRVPSPAVDSERTATTLDRFPGYADWKESPDDVLDIVDDLLKPFGLQVVMPDKNWLGGVDGFPFAIERRPTRKGDRS